MRQGKRIRGGNEGRARNRKVPWSGAGRKGGGGMGAWHAKAMSSHRSGKRIMIKYGVKRNSTTGEGGGWISRFLPQEALHRKARYHQAGPFASGRGGTSCFPPPRVRAAPPFNKRCASRQGPLVACHARCGRWQAALASKEQPGDHRSSWPRQDGLHPRRADAWSAESTYQPWGRATWRKRKLSSIFRGLKNAKAGPRGT